MANKIEIHPEALASFDKNFIEVGKLIRILPDDYFPKRSETKFPEPHVKDHISSKEIIGEPTMSLVDVFGTETALYFSHESNLVGLIADSYVTFEVFCDKIHKKVSNFLSRSFVKRVVWQHLIHSYRDDKAKKFTEFFLAEAESSLQECEVWIPIQGLQIERPFTIDKIEFCPINSDLIDKWFVGPIARRRIPEEQLTEMIEGHRQELQGLTAGHIILEAEPDRAKEIALELTSQTLAILRFFHPANHHPGLVCYSNILGYVTIPHFKFFIGTKGDALSWGAKALNSSPLGWGLEETFIDRMFADGLQNIINIIQNPQKSKFEAELLEALVLYSQNNLKENPFDKLIYIFPALERMLLANRSEPLQQNLRERMAFLITQDVSERREIISNFNEAYEIRSSYVHHGIDKSNSIILETFMVNAWRLFHSLILNHKNFKEKGDIVKLVETMKLS